MTVCFCIGICSSSTCWSERCIQGIPCGAIDRNQLCGVWWVHYITNYFHIYKKCCMLSFFPVPYTMVMMQLICDVFYSGSLSSSLRGWSGMVLKWMEEYTTRRNASSNTKKVMIVVCLCCYGVRPTAGTLRSFGNNNRIWISSNIGAKWHALSLMMYAAYYTTEQRSVLKSVLWLCWTCR